MVGSYDPASFWGPAHFQLVSGRVIFEIKFLNFILGGISSLHKKHHKEYLMSFFGRQSWTEMRFSFPPAPEIGWYLIQTWNLLGTWYV